MSKKRIIAIVVFTIILTFISLYFQWTEFYEGYSYDEFNFWVTIIFLLAWLLFSFYFGKVQEKKYINFLVFYWGINIISDIFICLFANNNFIQSLFFPFYVWFIGPVYGIRYVFFPLNRININTTTLILITSPLGMIFSSIGYWLGNFILKFKK